MSVQEDLLEAEVIQVGEGRILQYDRIDFEDLQCNDQVLSERDQKDILWGLEYGIHAFALSSTNSADHLLSVKHFLAENNVKDIKVLAKIETKEGRKHLDAISAVADGIILVLDSEVIAQDVQELSAIIEKIKSQ